MDLEIAYVYKYPVRKSRDDIDFWFIRQGGVYHKYTSDPRKNHWLLVFPNAESFSPGEVVDAFTAGKHPLAPHLAFHFAHLGQWRWYMADFHAKVETAVSEKPIFPVQNQTKSAFDKAKTLMNVEIEAKSSFVEMYGQISSLRFVETKLKPLVPIFAAHNRVLAKLRTWNHDLRNQQQISEPLARDFSSQIDNHEAKLQVLEQNVQFLLSRTASIIQMVSTKPQVPRQICLSATNAVNLARHRTPLA